MKKKEKIYVGIHGLPAGWIDQCNLSLPSSLLIAQPPQEQTNCRSLIKVRFHTMLILKNILFLGFQTPSHRSLFTMYPNLYINLAYLFSMAAHLSENERGFTLGLVKVDVSQTN